MEETMSPEWFRAFMSVEGSYLGVEDSLYNDMFEFMIADFTQEVTFKTPAKPIMPVIVKADHFAFLGDDEDMVSLAAKLNTSYRVSPDGQVTPNDSYMPDVVINTELPSTLDVLDAEIDTVAPVGINSKKFPFEHVEALDVNTQAIAHLCNARDNPDYLLINHGAHVLIQPDEKEEPAPEEDFGHGRSVNLKFACSDPRVVSVIKKSKDSCDDVMYAEFAPCPPLPDRDVFFHHGHNQDLETVPYLWGKAYRPGGDTLGEVAIGKMIAPSLRDRKLDELTYIDVHKMYVAFASQLFYLTPGLKLRTCVKMTTEFELKSFLMNCILAAFVSGCEEDTRINIGLTISTISCGGAETIDKADIPRFFRGYPFPGPSLYKPTQLTLAEPDAFVGFWSSCADHTFSMIYDVARFVSKIGILDKFGMLTGDLYSMATDFFTCFGKGELLGLYSVDGIPDDNITNFVKVYAVNSVSKQLGNKSHLLKTFAYASNPAYVICFISNICAQVGRHVLPDPAVAAGLYLNLACIGFRYNKSLHLLAALRRLAYLHRSVIYFGENIPERNFSRFEVTGRPPSRDNFYAVYDYRDAREGDPFSICAYRKMCGKSEVDPARPWDI